MSGIKERLRIMDANEDSSHLRLDAIDEIERLEARLAELENVNEKAEKIALRLAEAVAAMDGFDCYWCRGSGNYLNTGKDCEYCHDIRAFLRPADSAPAHHWQCQRCGTMNTEPHCPCSFDQDASP